MKLNLFNKSYLLLFLFLITAIKAQSDFKLDYEKYILANGLQVILHQDKSDPIAAVAIQFHVGSNQRNSRKNWICPFV